MFYPSLEEVKMLSCKYNMIPVSMEVYADMETPISIFKRFEDTKYCFLLESVEGGEKWARYSFIGRNPFLIVKSQGEKTQIVHKNGQKREVEGNPLHVLRDIMSEYKGAPVPKLPRFNGGAVGFFGYDLVRHSEYLPNVPKDDQGLPESHFMFMDEIIVFDHLKQKIHIIVNMHMNGNVERTYNSAVTRLKDIYREIISSRWKIEDRFKPDFEQKKSEFSYKSSVSKEKYCENVEKAKQYIKDGDIFQVVLSQRLEVETEQNPFNVYRVLRIINPSPYMYFLKFDDYCLAGSSPEMLVRVEDGTVETCPIAGTRKRGATKEEDEALEKDLLADEKELAEHRMLVDLGRNDIGKVSEFGSVVVRDIMHIERFSHVMHIASSVQGTLKEGKTAFDALTSVLPAGTLSGAPKIRAMEIIDELEPTKRGTYGGAIGYLSFNGNLDSCITIRTILFKGKKAYVQSGAGIVADSVPEKEYEETINKAMALLKSLEEVGEIR
ncbi:MAG: anthranilate synthase component I [Clostridia bacterium]|nr:anthranilate synthase component I [Clostridia bacterium]